MLSRNVFRRLEMICGLILKMLMLLMLWFAVVMEWDPEFSKEDTFGDSEEELQGRLLITARRWMRLMWMVHGSLERSVIKVSVRPADSRRKSRMLSSEI